jgi:pilus assembly protein CpaF
MLQAMNTGHTGSMSTIHANGAADALARLEAMVVMAATGLPLAAVRRQIAAAIHLVVHMVRRPDGARAVAEVLRVQGIQADELLVAPAIASTAEAGSGNGTRLRGINT